jgi:hypothetical protein
VLVVPAVLLAVSGEEVALSPDGTIELVGWMMTILVLVDVRPDWSVAVGLMPLQIGLLDFGVRTAPKNMRRGSESRGVLGGRGGGCRSIDVAQ